MRVVINIENSWSSYRHFLSSKKQVRERPVEVNHLVLEEVPLDFKLIDLFSKVMPKKGGSLTIQLAPSVVSPIHLQQINQAMHAAGLDLEHFELKLE